MSGKNYTRVWNPAGTEIAYEHESPGHIWNIWMMRADGSNKRQWTNAPSHTMPWLWGYSNLGVVNWARWVPDNSNLLSQYQSWNVESGTGSNRRTMTQGCQPNWQPVH